jgi:uncharacterized protein (TIGR02453 family)
MSNAYNLHTSLSFLAALAPNNEKPWFDAHKSQYEAAKQNFEVFVTDLIEHISQFDDLGGLRAKDSIMRIYRDIRFSKDKTPYKDHLGASLAPGGKKAIKLAYYFHLAPHDKSLAAGGLWDPTPEQLAAFRQVIDRDPKPFKAIIEAPAFVKTFGGVKGNQLANAPKNYPKDHPEIALLRQKQICVWQSFTDDALVAPNFCAQIAASFKIMKPFLDYLNALI